MRQLKRNGYRVISSLSSLAIVVMLHAAGCGSAAEFEADRRAPAECVEGGAIDCTGEPPPPLLPLDCEKSPYEDGDVIQEECGIFVSPWGSDSGNGTRKAPLSDLQSAINVGATLHRKVFVCAGEFNVKASISIPSGLVMYGGLDCGRGMKSQWKVYDRQSKIKTKVIGQPDVITLKLEGDGQQPTLVDGFEFRAASAAATGGSSIAMVATNSYEATFEECVIESMDGRAGEDGEGFSADDPPMLPVEFGAYSRDNGKNETCCSGCTSMGSDGGEAWFNRCTGDDPTLYHSWGGRGGKGVVYSGSASNGSGEPGTAKPVSKTSAPTENGGKGLKDQSCVNRTNGLGDPGKSGDDGASGSGGKGIGVLSITDGWKGSPGVAGKYGFPGQGGGGGAGAVASKNTCVAASGGAGGPGGCGGAPGKPGGAGGSSIAVVSINATLRFSNVTINSGKGGNGGKGSSGQLGGLGGEGGTGGVGPPKHAGCNGAQGGEGGAGGPGGGGAGGHSIGIAYAGNMPKWNSSEVRVGGRGTGGDGGNLTSGGSDLNGKGSDGISEQLSEFPAK